VNTAEEPERITPRRAEWRHDMNAAGGGGATYVFPPHSFTVIRLD
jgi:hypothetical protein